jgi:hypothetical protein
MPMANVDIVTAQKMKFFFMDNLWKCVIWIVKSNQAAQILWLSCKKNMDVFISVVLMLRRVFEVCASTNLEAKMWGSIAAYKKFHEVANSTKHLL